MFEKKDQEHEKERDEHKKPSLRSTIITWKKI
jgi:hypothetical protein